MELLAEERNPRVDAVIARIKRLPPLPDSIRRINRMIDDEQATLDAVAREIAKDLSISAQVLQLVNSSFYGFSGTVSSITHAVVMLGLNVVRSLVSTSWLSGMMERSSSGFYHHSLATARTCFILSRSLGMDEPEEMGAIGLLHDIGKVVVAEFLPEDFAAIKRIVAEKQLRFCEAEVEVLGVDHAELGARLLQKWNLSEETFLPIQYHHSAGAPDTFRMRTAILVLADCMTRAEGFGYAGDNRMPVLHDEVAETLDLAVEDLEALSGEMYDQMRDIPRYKGEFAA